MVRAPRHRPLLVGTCSLAWAIHEDIFLMDNQNLPIEEQARHLGRSEDDVSSRRGTLGILRRMQSI